MKIKFRRPPTPLKMPILTGKWQKWSTFVAGIPDMTLEGLGGMFRGYSAKRCSGQIPLVSMGVQAEGPACADTGARTPISASGNFW